MNKRGGRIFRFFPILMFFSRTQVQIFKGWKILGKDFPIHNLINLIPIKCLEVHKFMHGKIERRVRSG